MLEVNSDNAGWADESFDRSRKTSIIVFFEESAKKNNVKTAKEGRPIFDPEVLIHKIVPGDKTEIVRRMREDDKEEFPREWARFEQKKAHQIEGTPLESVTWLERVQVYEMKAIGIHVLEQLADLGDGQGQRMMGFTELRDKARKHLKAARDGAALERAEAQKQKDDEEKAALQQQLEDMRQQMAALIEAQAPQVQAQVQEQVRRGPGRPPRAAAG